jgi:hypothetical protein
MAFSGKDILANLSDAKMYRYQINFTQALSKSNGVIAMLLHDSKKARQLTANLHYHFQRSVEPILLGRKYPRKHKAKP